MKKTKKALLLVLCAILLVGATIAGTVAYLTDIDEVVTNTFTVGNVAITMVESVVDEYGVATNGTTDTGNTYKLIPGHEYTKDPTITIAENSEDCYVFVKITNGLGEDATITMNTGWTEVVEGSNVWKYSTKLEDEEGKKSATPFSKFTFDAEADPADYTSASIVVNAYAIQADGFADVDAAWEGIKEIVLPGENTDPETPNPEQG